MFRLVYRPSPLGTAVILGSLVFVVFLLVGAVEQGESAIPELIIWLGTVVALLTFLYLFIRGPTTWEVDDFMIRQTVGHAVTNVTPLAAAVRLRARPWYTPDSVALEVIDAQSETLFVLHSGEGVAVADVQAFYEALASSLGSRKVSVSNPFGWHAKAPTAEVRHCTGTWMKPRDFVFSLIFSSVMGGTSVLAANPSRTLAYDAFGVGLIGAALVGGVAYYWPGRGRRARS